MLIDNYCAKNLFRTCLRIIHRLPGRPIEVRLYYGMRFSVIPTAPANGFTFAVRFGNSSDVDEMVRCVNKRDRYESRLSLGDHCLIVLDKGEVVGFLWFCDRDTFSEEQVGYTFPIHKDSIYTYDVYVRPEYRRQGVLGNLFAFLYAWMEKQDKHAQVILISYDNEISWKVHLKKGFVPVKEVLYLRVFGKRVFLERPIRQR